MTDYVPAFPLDVPELRAMAQRIRQRDIQIVHNAKMGHVGGELSCIDILVTLYFAILNVDAQQPNKPDRDRFILSKGHAAVALYTTLAHRGFIPLSQLETFAQPLSLLNGHPDRNKVPGVETNTGPLGHGLPVAVGAAIRGAYTWSPVTVSSKRGVTGRLPWQERTTSSTT